MKTPLVNSISDLYTLHDKREELANLQVNGKKLGEKRAATILEEINKTRTLTIDQFLGSLGIKHLGRRKVQLIIEAAAKAGISNSIVDFNDVSTWMFRSAGTSDGYLTLHAAALGIPGVAREIQDDIDSKEDEIKALLNYIKIKEPERVEIAANATLTGKTFCFTGCRATPEELKTMASLGGVEKSGVAKGLTYLVSKDSDSTSSKAMKAKELGVTCISIQQFRDMLK